jgi:hypothetical protein
MQGPPGPGSLIATADHCYTCTAGSGFTWGGVIETWGSGFIWIFHQNSDINFSIDISSYSH